MHGGRLLPLPTLPHTPHLYLPRPRAKELLTSPLPPHPLLPSPLLPPPVQAKEILTSALPVHDEVQQRTHVAPPPPHSCLPAPPSSSSAPPPQAKEILTSALPVHDEVQRTHVDAVLNLVARNKVRKEAGARRRGEEEGRLNPGLTQSLVASNNVRCGDQERAREVRARLGGRGG